MTATISAETQRRTLHEALRHLAGLDPDRAGIENGVGFAGCDTEIGHALAERAPESWTPRQTYAAFRIARRYRNTQLRFIDFDAIGEPEKPSVAEARERMQNGIQRTALPPRRDPAVVPPSTIGIRDGLFVVSWAYGDPDFDKKKFTVKSTPGARWNPEMKLWTLPVTPKSVTTVISLSTDYALADSPFEVSDAAAEEVDAAVARFADNIRASHAKDADHVVEGLSDGLSLFPFQRAGVAFAVQHKRVIIGDDMGLGKTPQAIAAIVDAGAFPALVVCPSSLKLNWLREINRWIAPGAKPLRIMVASGTEAEGITIPADVDIVIANYDILGNYDYRERRWIGRKTKKGEGSRGWGETLSATRFRAIVCDEAHKLKSGKSQRTKSVREIVRAVNPELVLLLTGTPFLNRPIEGWTLIDLIGHGVKTFGGWKKFVYRYCGGGEGWGGSIDVSGATNLPELNELLRSSGAMIRRRKADVLTELPSRSWATVPVEMTAAGARSYRAVENDIAGFMANRKAESEKLEAEWIAEYAEEPMRSETQAEYIDRKRATFRMTESARLSQSEELLRWEALKQAAAAAKEEAAIAWIEDFLESGEKLVVFGVHRDLIKKIAAKFNAPTIMGGQKPEEIEAGKERFQNDPECKVIACNIMAGGVGHTLTAASNVAFLEFAWTPGDMDQALDRCHRIGQEKPVTGWLLAAELPGSSVEERETIDGALADIIAAKRTIVTAAADGAGEAAQVKTFDELRKRLDRQKGR